MVGEPAEIFLEDLYWDEEIREHIRRHSIEQEDVEAVLRGGPRFFSNLPGRAASHVMLGYDGKGRALYVAIQQMSDTTWAPVTAWESRQARRLLEES